MKKRTTYPKVQYNGISKTDSKAIYTYEPINDRDEQQPRFIFSMTANTLLCAMANGCLDPVKLARLELANRGLNIETGEWVGFRESTKQYNRFYKTTNACDYEVDAVAGRDTEAERQLREAHEKAKEIAAYLRSDKFTSPGNDYVHISTDMIHKIEELIKITNR